MTVPTSPAARSASEEPARAGMTTADAGRGMPGSWAQQKHALIKAEDRVAKECAAAASSLLGDHLIVVDVEWFGARIIEVGMVRLSFGWIEAVESFLVHPGLDALPHNPVGKAARATFNLVVGSPSFGDAAVHFANFAAGHRLFTGWNVGNDKAKVTDEFDRLGADRGEMDWVDGRVLFNEALRRTWTGRHPGAGLKDAYGHYFGPGWEQPKPHNALDDAVHTAHVLLAVCRDLAGSGLRPELVSKMPGRLGSDWRPDFTVGEPVRRGMLPPQSRCGGLFQADQWREAQDLPLRERCGGAFPSVADRPGLSDDDSVDAVVIAARERRQLHRLRVEGNVVDGPVHLPLPVREREAFEAAQEAKAVKAAESMRTPQAPWAQSAAGYGPTAD